LDEVWRQAPSLSREMGTRTGDTPDIVVLPPVLVGSTLLVGIGLHYLVWPITLLPVVLARVLGVSVFIASGLLAHAAQRAMMRAGTNVLPTRPTLALAVDGPYRFTRNPLYLAAIGVALGVALWVDGVIPLLALVPMIVILHWGVVTREEQYLARRFGSEYEAYRARVRRWI
jgi:protein-S-isoprenylcysteine O-methyltransferase Ste14